MATPTCMSRPPLQISTKNHCKGARTRGHFICRAEPMPGGVFSSRCIAAHSTQPFGRNGINSDTQPPTRSRQLTPDPPPAPPPHNSLS